jgi:hypothetical protein
MKKLFSLFVMALLVTGMVPAVFAAHIGTGIGVDIETEDFAPLVFFCNDRVVGDDDLQPSLYSEGLRFRSANYAFEGESIFWKVLVMDKNGKEKIEDVYATIGDVQGEGNDIEVNCVRTTDSVSPYDQCDAKILEEEVEWNPSIMAVYECTLTVETAESMYGEYWITVEATDLDGLTGTMDENEYWFLNPVIALSIDGDLTFEDVRPGSDSYSETILVGNDADEGSGVRLDMFISGTDFYDSSSSGAMCPVSNVLNLEQFTYYALNGPHSTDVYLGIKPGDQITEAKRIMDGQLYATGGLNYENLLSPGSEMALTFKLSLPEPCNGDFDTGNIYFWGEAI